MVINNNDFLKNNLIFSAIKQDIRFDVKENVKRIVRYYCGN